MLQYEELRLKLEGLKPEIDDLANALRLEQCRRDLDGLEIKASEQGFWDNMESAQAVLQKISGLKETISRYEKLVADYRRLNPYRACGQVGTNPFLMNAGPSRAFRAA